MGEGAPHETSDGEGAPHETSDGEGAPHETSDGRCPNLLTYITTSLPDLLFYLSVYFSVY